jgi:hypothetical protein
MLLNVMHASLQAVLQAGLFGVVPGMISEVCLLAFAVLVAQ